MNERTHFFLKIYLSHFILERVDVSYVWELSWRWGQTATYWPKVPLTIAALLSHPAWAAQPWVTEGTKPSVCHWLSLRHLVPNWLQLQLELTQTGTDWLKPSVAPGYIFVWCPPASCGRTHLPPSPNSTTSTGQGDILISLTGCTYFAVLPLIYTGASLDWRLGRGSIYNKKCQHFVFMIKHSKTPFPHNDLWTITFYFHNFDFSIYQILRSF